MWYISKNVSSGKYSVPQTTNFPDSYPITDEQVEFLVTHNGFVIVTETPDPAIPGSAVTLTVNTEAWEEWKASLPPEPEPEPTEIEQLRAQVADLQNQILTMRLGG